VLHHEPLSALVILGCVEVLAQEVDDAPTSVFIMGFLFEIVPGVLQNLDRSKDKECTENIEGLAEVFNECSAKQDKNQPQNQCNRDTNQQCLTTQHSRHGKLGKNHEEDKDVVNRK